MRLFGARGAGAQRLRREEFFSVNVLENPDIRQGIKDYANWPTIPQLYVKGEFVGGSDIMKEMYQSGELQKLLEGSEAESLGRVGEPRSAQTPTGGCWPSTAARPGSP